MCHPVSSHIHIQLSLSLGTVKSEGISNFWLWTYWQWSVIEYLDSVVSQHDEFVEFKKPGKVIRSKYIYIIFEYELKS